MARRGRAVRIPGFRAYLGEVTQVTAKEAATQIVGRLIFLGPWYSGQFARNWVVKVGDVRIPATVEPESRFDGAGGFKARTARGQLNLPPVPSLRGTGKKKIVGYTIGNRVTYRNIALDLEPGRVENAREISAERDWYRAFIEGGGLGDILGSSVAAAANDPKVKGFKGGRFTGPVGRLVNQ
jgi:hypothetical protein